jgi:hypothetical protein
MAKASVDEFGDAGSTPVSNLSSIASQAANAILTGKALPTAATSSGYAAAQAQEAAAAQAAKEAEAARAAKEAEATAAAKAAADKTAADRAAADKAAAEAAAAQGKTVADLQKQLADLKTANATQTALAQANTQQQQQNAITMLTQTFINYGLSADIAGAVTNLVQQGYTADTIQVMAQDPKGTNPLAQAFQQRFPANAARMAAGLPVLSPAQYIANEQGYAQVMRAYGLNPSFATNKDVFTKLLTNDVSPTELNGRVNTAKQVIENTDPAVAEQLQTYYGLSQGDMIAHVLDPSIATPILEKQISTSQIGAEAARYGANVGQSYAEQLSNLGVTQAQAGQGFQNIAQQLPGTQELATRYAGYTPAGQIGQELQAATFGTTGAIQAQQDLERLKTQEISQFSGSSGAGKGSLMGAEEGVS